MFDYHYFGSHVKPVDQVSYQAVSKGTGYVTRPVSCDGEFRLLHGEGMETLLLVEDEVIVNTQGQLLGVKTSLNHFYLVV